MNLTRREFAKSSLTYLLSAANRASGGYRSALGFLALPGTPMFAAPDGWKAKKKPNLVFGILSDTHLQSAWDGVTPHAAFPLTYVTNAMQLFQNRGIDAFMHLGDAAHRGKNVEVQYHRDIFEKCFPDGKAKDGRTVEKLLVVGNHHQFRSSLKELPNAVSFFGHWHCSNADWKTIYYDGWSFPEIC